MTKTTIRRATVADAPVLAELGARTFAETFGHLYPAEDLSAFVRETHSLEKVAAELADPAIAAWLAEREGAAVGYAVAGPCKLPHRDVTPACGELKRIYVEAGLQGDGVGGRLLAAALAWLERDGPRRLWIGVWSENLGAQRLYERHGFAKVGEYGFRVGGIVDHEFILRRG
ncbi:MAG: GNAT family N-acetyltransferase [Caulobacteraceae bacterium]